jgi:hypothetical protein
LLGADLFLEQFLLRGAVALDLQRLFVEAHEHANLRADDGRIERLEHVVYRAVAIALE